MSAYDELLGMAERESDLIRAGAWEELVASDGERRALVARLPESPPPAARRRLELAISILERNAAAIGAAMAQTRGDLDRIVRARRALGSYAHAAQPLHDLRG